MTDQVSQKELDLLAEGELSMPQRRALLERIAASPDGWQHCAWALLESQAIQVAMRPENSGPRQSPRTAPGYGARTNHPGSRRGSFAQAAALAVSLGLMFLFGLIVPRMPSAPVTLSVESPPPADSANGERGSGVQPHVVGFAQIHGRTRRVPVLSGAGIGRQRFDKVSSPTASDVERRLARSGWRVVRNREYVSVRLTDGRQMTIPIEAVQVRFAGVPVF